MASSLCLLAFGALLVSASAGVSKISPVESVVNLIEKLQAQTIAEGKTEAAAYDKYACFCKEQADDKFYSITNKDEQKAMLTASIKSLSGEIAELNKNLARMNKELQALQKQCADEQLARDKEFAEYVVLRDDLAGAIAGADEAIELLKSQKAPGQFLIQAKTKVSNAFLRLAEAPGALPPAMNDVMSGALLQLTEDPKASEFHSDAIIEMMLDFKKKFKAHKISVDEDENDKKHVFDMAQAARKNEVAALEANIEEAEKQVGDKEAQKEDAENNLAKTSTDRDADQNFLNDLTNQCEATSKLWDQRSTTRAAELQALSKALDALKGEVSGNYNANKKLVAFVDSEGPDDVASPEDDNVAQDKDAHIQELLEAADSESTGISLLQRGKGFHHHMHDKELARQVMGYLNTAASRLHSTHLSQLVTQMKIDHFVKVRTMIKDMIAKLEADATAEANQKQWCDDEMTRAMGQRDENIGAIEGDTAVVTKSAATIAKRKEEVAALTQEIADLKKGLAEATTLRKEEQEENTKTVTDSTNGLAGVNKAISILKEFYDNALIQTKAKYTPPNAGADGATVGDLAPDTGFATEAHGNQDAATGIMGMLEVIKSDFERTIDTVNTEESENEDEFQTYKSETDGDTSEKQGVINDKNQEIGDTEGVLSDSKDDLAEHTSLKNDALKELAKLKPACVDTGDDYGEKVARREQEIESLKNAYTILDEMR